MAESGDTGWLLGYELLPVNKGAAQPVDTATPSSRRAGHWVGRRIPDRSRACLVFRMTPPSRSRLRTGLPGQPRCLPLGPSGASSQMVPQLTHFEPVADLALALGGLARVGAPSRRRVPQRRPAGGSGEECLAEVLARAQARGHGEDRGRGELEVLQSASLVAIAFCTGMKSVAGSRT